MGCCNLEYWSMAYNVGCTLLTLACFIAIFGKSSWCQNKEQSIDFCASFADGLGYLFLFLILLGSCITPCIFDALLSYISKCTNHSTFDSQYKDIHEHSFNMIDNYISINSSNDYLTDISNIPKIPIIYSSKYNMSAFGLEKLHPFDGCKYGRIHSYLVSNHTFTNQQFIRSVCATRSDLLSVHTSYYLSTLTSSWVIMKILELPGLCLVPAPFLFWRVLLPMLYQTGGSILGIEFAFRYGWSINLGGGFHHASSAQGSGFCVYADISIVVKYIRCSHMRKCKILICDLDAHQGNGHARDGYEFDKEMNGTLKILDAYNAQIYPNDRYAKQRIDFPVILGIGTPTEYYLGKVQDVYEHAIDSYAPGFIIYNAGTDCLDGDPLGAMQISAQGIIDRDEIVFRCARERDIPILMVLSGGYQMNNARIIARSISNLKEKQLLKMRNRLV